MDYWKELCEIMAWTRTHVHSTLHICWGAQAGLYYHYGIPKRTLPKKLFGIYEHDIIRKQSPLFRGFDDKFYAPHSRYTEVALEDILKIPELEPLATSREPAYSASKARTTGGFSSLPTRSTTRTPWPGSISGTWPRG